VLLVSEGGLRVLNLLCKIGLHAWGKAKQWKGVLQRRCERCGKLEGRKVKKISFVLLFILVLSSISYAQEGFAVWSPRKAADAVIVARPAYLLGIVITPDGTNACKVDLYNNASTNAGNYVSFNVPAGEAGTSGFLDPYGSFFDTGIYADMTVAAGACGFNVKYR